MGRREIERERCSATSAASEPSTSAFSGTARRPLGVGRSNTSWLRRLPHEKRQRKQHVHRCWNHLSDTRRHHRSGPVMGSGAAWLSTSKFDGFHQSDEGCNSADPPNARGAACPRIDHGTEKEDDVRVPDFAKHSQLVEQRLEAALVLRVCGNIFAATALGAVWGSPPLGVGRAAGGWQPPGASPPAARDPDPGAMPSARCCEEGRLVEPPRGRAQVPKPASHSRREVSPGPHSTPVGRWANPPLLSSNLERPTRHRFPSAAPSGLRAAPRRTPDGGPTRERGGPRADPQGGVAMPTPES